MRAHDKLLARVTDQVERVIGAHNALATGGSPDAARKLLRLVDSLQATAEQAVVTLEEAATRRAQPVVCG